MPTGNNGYDPWLHSYPKEYLLPSIKVKKQNRMIPSRVLALWKILPAGLRASGMQAGTPTKPNAHRPPTQRSYIRNLCEQLRNLRP